MPVPRRAATRVGRNRNKCAFVLEWPRRWREEIRQPQPKVRISELGGSFLLGVAEVDHDRCRAEPMRLVTDIENTDREPNAPDGLCETIQVKPDQSAEGKTNQRKQSIA